LCELGTCIVVVFLADVDIAHFCSNDVKRGKALYLANTEYPESLKGEKHDCACMVRTLGGSEGINIHSIDILLTWPAHEHGASRRVCYKVSGWMDGWMEGWVGGWMDGWVHA
jgi:hypothetical protein